MRKKARPYRRFSNCVQACFGTVENNYLFKGEAENLFVNLCNVSVVNPVFDKIGGCNSIGIKELSSNRVEPSDKYISNINCAVEKSIGHGVHYNVFAKTFFPQTCVFISHDWSACHHKPI